MRLAFILNMLKTNATIWCLHRVLDSMLWGRCGNNVGCSRAPWARCGCSVCTLYSRRVNPVFVFALAIHFNNDICNHNRNSNIIIIMNANGTII